MTLTIIGITLENLTSRSHIGEVPHIQKKSVADDTLRRLDKALKRVQLQVAKEQLADLRQSRWKKPVAAVLMACLGLLVSVTARIVLVPQSNVAHSARHL